MHPMHPLNIMKVKMNRFNNKIYIVTGASSGIGQATAIRLSEEGARVILVARNDERLKVTLDQLKGEGHCYRQCDITNEANLKSLFKELPDDINMIDGAVHCAGIHWLKPLKVTREIDIDEMLRSHLFSSILFTKSLVFSRKLNKQTSSIVWLSSVAAIKGEPGAVAYSAAKGGMISAARTLAAELASRNIRINVVSPGVIETPLSEAFMGKMPDEQRDAIINAHPLGIGKPENVSSVASFLLSDDASWITGTNIIVDGGLSL